MNKKKIVCLVTCMCILMNTSVMAKGIPETEGKTNRISHSTSNQSVSTKGFTFKNLSQTENYSKDKITNLKTNEVEYLEQFVEKDSNGNVSKKTVVTNKNGEKTFIENKGDNVVVSKNDVVLYEMPAGEIKTEGRCESNLSKSYGSWSGPLITYTHRSFPVGITVSIAAGLLLNAMYPDAPVGTTIVSAVAGAIVMECIPDVYIRMETYTRVDQANSRYQSKRTCFLYRYSNYTGFIDSVGPETWEYDYSGL